MPSGSGSTRVLFVLLVGVVFALFAWTVAKAWGRAGGASGRWSWLRIVAGVLLAYLVVPGVLAARGELARYNPLPAPALLLVAALTLLTVVLALSPLGGRLTARVSLAALVGYQVFRLPVELLLHRLYTEGVVPVEMTYQGRNFDIVTAVTALLAALYLRSGRRAPGLVLAWNLLGLALLVNIVLVAVLATPVPFRRFDAGPPNLLPSTFPYVWLPSFLVQAALFGHLVVFRVLARAGARAVVPA